MGLNNEDLFSEGGLVRMVFDFEGIGQIGSEEFNKYHDVVFGKEVLNYAKSMVINLPSSCYCNCKYYTNLSERS